MTTAGCPSRETLRQYSVGMLSEEQSDELASHLDSCTDCQATILTLEDAEDTLVGRLRTPPASEPYSAEPAFQAALAQVLARNEDGSAAPLPRALGEYEILEELGHGGMGRVYKAWHTKLDRVVAVKVLPRGRAGDHQAIGRFGREMKAVGRLVHPNIVQAYDAREIDGTPVLVMEFVDGLDLAALVRRLGRLPVAEACELVRQTAVALQCAHEHGLVHRDIKPSNIMLARTGEVKLLDLGLARFYAGGPVEGAAVKRSDGAAVRSSDGAAVELSPQRGSDPAAVELPPQRGTSDDMTGTGQAMGTADYMAPEQAADSRTVDIRADLYSLGCTLYKLISGQAPFSGPAYPGTLEKMHAHVHQPVPPLGQRVAGVPPELAAIADRMLAKNPSDRFAAPAEVAQVLLPFCVGASLPALFERAEASPSSPLPPGEGQGEGGSAPAPRPAARRWRSIVALTCLMLFVGGFFFALGIMIRIKKDGQETTVEVPEGSATRVGMNGQVEVQLPGQVGSSRSAAAVTPAAAAKALQGTWQLLSSRFRFVECVGPYPSDEQWRNLQPEALKLQADALKTTKVVITADMLKIVGPHVLPIAYSYEANSAASPPMIDLKGFGASYFGIFRIDGDRLMICADPERHDRPTQFWAESQSDRDLLVLQRVGDAVVTEDEKAIQGSWQVESISPPHKKEEPFVSRSGQLMGLGDFQNFFFAGQRVTVGRYEITVQQPIHQEPGAVHDVCGYALDPSAQPKRIGLVVPGRMPGIYRLEGDRLTLCISLPAENETWRVAYKGPPATFTAGLDSVLIVLKRVTGAAAPPKAAEQPTASPLNAHPGTTVLFFHADWASPCQRMAPLVDALASEGYAIQRVNIDRERALTKKFGITAVPCLIVLAGEKEVDRVVGVATLQRVAKMLPAPAAAAGAAAAPPSGPEIFVSRPVVRDVTPYEEFTGRIEAAKPPVPGASTMYVVFDADQRTVLQIRRLVLEEKKAGKAPTEFPVRCALADDKDFPYRGKLESVDVPIDPKTGAATWRALLPNPEGILMPGLFVRVRLFISAPHKAMLIPEQAIGADQGQKFVYVVADKVVQYRRIQVGTLEDGLRVVNEGLTADDWVVTAQVSKLRPGMIVTPQPAPSPAAPSPAAGPAVSPVADLKALEGQWKVVRVEKGKDADFNWTDILYGGGLVRVEGEKLYDPTGADRFAFTESGDGWQFQVRNSETTGMAGLVPMLWFCGGNSFRIDPSAAPKTIDLMGDSNRLVAVGIYEIDGDRLKLCLSRYLAALKSEQRPESFTVAPASEDISFVLERFHPPQDEKTIQGTWKITEQVEDGKPLSEEQRRRKSCWTGPDLLSCMTKMADGKTKSEAGMNFVLDTSKQPRWITLFQGGLVEPRKNKWEVLPGIYKFEGERLSIAYRKDGPRPEKFESPAGSGITLLVLERTKPPEMKGGMGQGGGMGMY